MPDQRLTTTPNDVWESGEEYEPYVGRWSRLVAREFLAWRPEDHSQESWPSALEEYRHG